MQRLVSCAAGMVQVFKFGQLTCGSAARLYARVQASCTCRGRALPGCTAPHGCRGPCSERALQRQLQLRCIAHGSKCKHCPGELIVRIVAIARQRTQLSDTYAANRTCPRSRCPCASRSPCHVASRRCNAARCCGRAARLTACRRRCCCVRRRCAGCGPPAAPGVPSGDLSQTCTALEC